MRTPALALFALFSMGHIPAATLTALYSFTGQNGDGASPYAAVVMGADGSLYGTTGFGGIYGAGTVFQLTPVSGGWNETVVYSFTGGSDGGYPQSGVIFSAGGAIYGTTSAGGAAGLGTVFELTSGPGVWTETVLYSFSGSDGAYPYASVVLAASGALYGTTELGGALGYGVVFELTPPTVSGGAWTETVLYSFTGGDDGAFPYAGVAIDGKGDLFGTAAFGGTSQKGTVFKLTPPAKSGGAWTETVLHNFTGSDGGFPYAGVILGTGGVLYGTTTGGVTAGNGTAFELTPPSTGKVWKETILHKFTGGADGASPHAALTAGPKGTLLGTGLGGGAAPSWNGHGVVFELVPPSSGGAWTETVPYTFQGGDDGGDPDAPLTAGASGVFYGTSLRGGTAGLGTVFQVSGPEPRP
jgi:uncharacterized repeat protein (TIGR03803 family)